MLAFRTFAYIRVGILLGQLLVDHDVEPYDGTDTWVELLMRQPQHRDAVAKEVRAVAEEIAADPAYADDEPLGPDDAVRERFREFARQRLVAGVAADSVTAGEADREHGRETRQRQRRRAATRGARARAAAGRCRP